MSDNRKINLNTTVKLLTINPQDQIQQILNTVILLEQESYNSGTLILPSLTELPSGSDEETFEANKVILTEGCNTVVIFSEQPFDLQVGDNGEIHLNIYHFSYVSVDDVSISVSNHSTTVASRLNYFLTVAEPVGSSYVYT